jgi:hypothetical protein
MQPIPVRRSRTVCPFFIAAAVAGLAACSSAPDASATVDSMGSFGVATAKAKDSIDDTIKALETLVATAPADLKARLESYSKCLAALDEQAKVVRGHADEMKASGDAFFKEWESGASEASASVNPERRTQLSASYSRIKDDMTLARDEFTPFLASLKDIESYLTLDPSQQGINSMVNLVKTAKANGAKVKSRIDAVLMQMNSVRGMLSTRSG